MQTLTQYQYLDVDAILSGVADWLVKESPILGILPQKPIQGNSFLYNISLTLPTAAWVATGQQLSESTGTFEQRSTSIFTLIQDALTDKGAIAMNSTQDPEMVDMMLAAQAMAHEWEKTFIHGQTTTGSTSKQFKGLLRMIAEFESASTTDLDGATAGGGGNNSQVLAANATTGALSMALMDELVDMVKPGKPDLLLMSRLSRRRINALQRAAGNAGMQMGQADLFGKFMDMYDGIPILVSDWLVDNVPDNSSSVLTISTYDYDAARSTGDSLDNSLIFAMKLGERDVQGLHSGQMAHERSGFTEDYNAIRNRLIWYPGLMCASKYSMAVLTGTSS